MVTAKGVKGSKEFEAKFEIWRNNLLDMSSRNKQIHFKPAGKNALEILHPKMVDLFETLVIKNKRFIFAPVFEPSMIKKEPSESEADFKKRLQEIHWKRISDKSDSKTRNHELITKISDKLLEKDIKKVISKAKSSLAEHGINTLFITFGLIKWYDTDDKKHAKPIFSPIYFVPITISRKRILDSFHIEILDDEVLVNPSINEKFKTTYQMELPEFPNEFNIEQFQEHLNQIRNMVMDVKDWNVFERSFVGLFDFAKLNMFDDIVGQKEALLKHRLTKAIAEGSGFEEDPKNIPDDSEYTDEGDPFKSYHVIDSDSSQFKAIIYARKGASMVIRGPPGTGKSQAISNIIAECLGAGKRVLFVAQKRAALDVVMKRLSKVGVGEFCLELHSEKANKIEFLKQLNRSLSSDLIKRAYKKFKYKNLHKQRSRLNEYVNNIHTKVGKSDNTVYERIGEYQKYNDIPYIDSDIRRPLEFTDDMIFAIEDILSQLDLYKHILEDYGYNPWAESGITSYTEEMQDEMYEILRDINDFASKVEHEVNVLEDRYNLNDIKDYDMLNDFVEFFKKYNDNAFDLDPATFLKYGSFVKVFNADYSTQKKIIEKAIKNKKDRKDLFGHAQKIQEFQNKYLKSPKLKSYKGVEKDFENILSNFEKVRDNKLKYNSLFMLDRYNEDEAPTEWKKLKLLSQYWLSHLDRFEDWCAAHILIEQLKQYGVDDFIEKLKDQPVLNLDVPIFDLFMKSFSHSWIKSGMSKAHLGAFNAKHHKRVKAQFVELDGECIKINRYRLAEMLFEKRPKDFWMSKGMKSSEFALLMREMAKKRNVKPIRTILGEAKNLITTVKPCFMMSPLSVAKFLPANDFMEYFDIVVFDEASQIPPEDAIGAILRAKQLIVVGDEKQLPPTKFFSKDLYDSSDDYEMDTDIFDSILEECTGIGLPVITLSFHYRSRKEGLISFSNYHFYEDNLISFPDPLREGIPDAELMDELPALEYHFIENGLYDKGKSRKNRIEAIEVANYIIQHYKNNKKNGTRYSLGVIAFSEAQMNAIQSALEKIYKNEPQLEILVSKYQEEPMFIKNLENVQGDERDVIFFSIGYGKDKEGEMSLNFGPLNKEGGERRLNVAITRARYHVKIFASFLPGELNLEKTSSVGVKLLIQYMEYARTGTFAKAGGVIQKKDDFMESLLEETVIKEIEKMGYTVDRNIGKSKFQINLAIADPENPTNYICAIELDGGSYRRTPCARDRDRTREIVLNGLGWQFYHIWSPEWFEDKDTILKEIDNLIKNALKERKLQKELIEQEQAALIAESETGKSKEEDISVEISVTEGAQPTELPKGDFEDIQKQYITIPGVIEYKPYDKKKAMDSDAFNRKPSRMKAAKEVINAEGPIHYEILSKRVREYFGLTSISGKIKEKWEDCLDELLDMFPSPIKDEDLFYYPKKFDENLVRIEVKKNEDPRKFEHISGIEIKNAMKIIIERALSIEKDELFLRTMQLFGFNSSRKEYSERLTELLNSLLDEFIIPPDSVRGHDYIPPTQGVKEEGEITNGTTDTTEEIPEITVKETEIPTEETTQPEKEEIKDFEKLKETEIEEIRKEVEETTAKTDTPIEGKFADVIDVLNDGLEYSFDELIEELDIENEEEIRLLISVIRELTENKMIEKIVKKDDTYWKIKK